MVLSKNIPMMTRKTCILLIDDDPFTLAMTKKTVEGLVKNGKIKTFCSAKDALNYLQMGNDISDEERAVPGIILSDLNMPCMDGFQFLDEFAKLTQAVRSQYTVFILSSTTDEKERAQLFEKISSHRFCSKPLTSEKFINLMEKARITL
jgi:CheY-like chemotaxis protein